MTNVFKFKFKKKYWKGKALLDFQLVPETQLNIEPQSRYINTTIEICAQMCTFAEAFLCRSFDFFTQTNVCFLYNANLKDKLSPNVAGTVNKECQHYSSMSFFWKFTWKLKDVDFNIY